MTFNPYTILEVTIAILIADAVKFLILFLRTL